MKKKEQSFKKKNYKVEKETNNIKEEQYLKNVNR